MKEMSFEEKIATRGVTEFTCMVEIARQLNKIAYSLEIIAKNKV